MCAATSHTGDRELEAILLGNDHLDQVAAPTDDRSQFAFLFGLLWQNHGSKAFREFA
jgi:hypothetical protein